MATAKKLQNVQCVFCLSKGKQLVDPRVLPCTHLACRRCLNGLLETQRAIRCKECNGAFHVQVDNLPVHNSGILEHDCDVCIKKGTSVKPAVIYCRDCSKKYCKAHQESHNDFHEDHVAVTIIEYTKRAGQLETRNCAKHKTQVYSLGCEVCLQVFCLSCISPGNSCGRGQSHKLLNLGELVTRLAGKIGNLKGEMKKKEGKLSALLKKTNKEMSEFERATQEMMDKLHAARDEQVSTIQAKYKKLEQELVAARRETYEKMAVFAEEEVGIRLANLSSQRTDIETKIKNNHQVDIVKAYKNMEAEMNPVTRRQLPMLKVMNVKALEVKSADSQPCIGVSDNTVGQAQAADPQQSIGVFDVTTGHAQHQVPDVTGGYSSVYTPFGYAQQFGHFATAYPGQQYDAQFGTTIQFNEPVRSPNLAQSTQPNFGETRNIEARIKAVNNIIIKCD
ncbi:E3 ubiquitin-protein ligase TRIM56-like [Watersipora subatra]|uniref:E3 ubiquitin-protein ligase TRIM56-like n=1 Tax=Watersipora subatra TaxID=2589382 RepID=UPI00355C518F